MILISSRTRGPRPSHPEVSCTGPPSCLPVGALSQFVQAPSRRLTTVPTTSLVLCRSGCRICAVRRRRNCTGQFAMPEMPVLGEGWRVAQTCPPRRRWGTRDARRPHRAAADDDAYLYEPGADGEGTEILGRRRSSTQGRPLCEHASSWRTR